MNRKDFSVKWSEQNYEAQKTEDGRLKKLHLPSTDAKQEWIKSKI